MGVRCWLCLTLALTGPASASTLNKCVDENGEITYTNLKCAKTQAVKKIELDPPPVLEPPRTVWIQVPVSAGQAVPAYPPPGQWLPGQVAPGQIVPGQTTPGQIPSANVPANPLLTPSPTASPPGLPQTVPVNVTPSGVLVQPVPGTTPRATVPGKPQPSAPAEIISPSNSPRSPNPARAAAPPMSEALCTILGEQIGEIFDKMDAARGKTTPEQMHAWQIQIQALEARKQASSCF